MNLGTQEKAAGRWMKLSDSAQVLGVSEITIRRRVKAGRLAYDFRGGKYYVFIPEGVDATYILDGDGEGEVQKTSAPLPASRAPLPTRQSPPAAPAAPAKGGQQILRPYAAPEAAKQPTPKPQGPSQEQVLTILKIELQQKEKEINSLKRTVADQATLIAALECSLDELSGQAS